MSMFYYVQKPTGEVLEYTRKEKAERVARLYNVSMLEKPTTEQKESAKSMYF